MLSKHLNIYTSNAGNSLSGSPLFVREQAALSLQDSGGTCMQEEHMVIVLMLMLMVMLFIIREILVLGQT